MSVEHATEVRDAVLSVLGENMADDVECIDLHGVHSVFSYMVIASSKTARHSVMLVNKVVDAVRGSVPHVLVEGMDTKNWISADFGDVALQVFLPEVRAYYKIESVWSNK